MNVETANRLMQYRKKAGLSQEELADKLGVSRQAVSKWECAESSPDTDNLIALSRIYGISLDELINGESEPKAKAMKDDGLNVHIKDDDGGEVNIYGLNLHVKDDDGSEVHIHGKHITLVDEHGHKIEKDAKNPRYLHTVTNVGYKLTPLGAV